MLATKPNTNFTTSTNTEGVDLSIECGTTDACHLPAICVKPRHKGQGRRYIAHGHGTDKPWVPHNECIQPQYTETGPDWSSRLRWLPHPQNPDYPAPENWPTKWHSPRYYPWTYIGSSNEWQIHPMETSMKTGRKCLFGDRIHRATRMTHGEITHSQKFGCRRKEHAINTRNSIWEASPGDKSYPVPECSANFHKLGSTRPLANFSQPRKNQTDTFVPLETLPSTPGINFKARERKIELQEEIDCVKSLDYWRPAIPLVETLPSDDKHTRRIVRDVSD